jgi:transposase
MAKATRWVGIDWAYSRAAWCALGAGGEAVGEGLVAADEDGLGRLVLSLGGEVEACVEMMSGSIWVRDRLAAAGWRVKIAHARKVRDVAPLACKTDKVDARVLAELCRRDLVPELWLPSLRDRELRERLRRRMHLVRLRTSARNRIFGLLTQWGLRLSLARLRRPEALELLESRGVPPVWRQSIAEALALIDLLDERIAPLDRELSPLAAADPRVLLLDTIPGVGALLGLTLASEIGDVARFGSPRKLIGYAGLAPRVSQSGQRSRTGKLSKAGPRNLRWAAVEAGQHGWRESNPWHRLYTDVARRHGKNPAKSAVARKVLIAAWHVLSRDEPFNPGRPQRGDQAPVSASSQVFLAA